MFPTWQLSRDLWSQYRSAHSLCVGSGKLSLVMRFAQLKRDLRSVRLVKLVFSLLIADIFWIIFAESFSIFSLFNFLCLSGKMCKRYLMYNPTANRIFTIWPYVMWGASSILHSSFYSVERWATLYPRQLFQMGNVQFDNTMHCNNVYTYFVMFHSMFYSSFIVHGAFY